MRKTFHLSLLGICFLMAPSLQAKGSKKPAGLEEVCDEVKEVVAQGDIVFVEINNQIFKHVADTQNSWASHVGLAFQDADEQWYVVESTIPLSKKTPLCEYLKKGYESHMGVKRLRGGLNLAEVEDLRDAAESRLGILYHLGFKYESARQFCSKLVYQSFDEALGIEIGKKQTFRELLDESEHPEGEKFWKKWFFGFIPWSRVTVTPGSQFKDDKLDPIYEREADERLF